MILIVRDTKTGKNREVELEKGEFIGVVGDHINSEEIVVKIIEKKEKKKPFLSIDYGVEGGDYTAWVSGYINKDGEIVIDREGYKKKEVKKVKPYLETKVVKVKKEEKRCNNYRTLHCPDTNCKYFWDCEIAETLRKIHKRKGIFIPEKKPKGNWVNGENLDKIKFPCFCRWSDNGWVGMIVKDWVKKEEMFTLVRVDRQTDGNHTYAHFKSLEELIKEYDIHILKGKIIIFEEE